MRLKTQSALMMTVFIVFMLTGVAAISLGYLSKTWGAIGVGAAGFMAVLFFRTYRKQCL